MHNMDGGSSSCPSKACSGPFSFQEILVFLVRQAKSADTARGSFRALVGVERKVLGEGVGLGVSPLLENRS